MTEQNEKKDFAAQAGEKRDNLASEFWAFMKDNKKWWLAPILITMLLFGLLILMSGTGAAPFIYTLF